MVDNRVVNQELRDGLEKASHTIKQYEEFFGAMEAGMLKRGTLISKDAKTLPSGKQVLVEMGEGTFAIPVSPNLEIKDLKPGQTIWVSKEGMAMGTSVPEPVLESKVVGVEGKGVLVSVNGEVRLVAAAPGVKEVLSIGDTVHMDAFGAVILSKTSKQVAYAVQAEKVSWADIGGLKEAKREMVEAIEMPLTHKDLFKRFNKKPIKGVLLYGPPGCGKTMLGKAAATAVAKLFGNTKTPGFFYLKGPEVLSKWVGESEASIRALFNKAREFKSVTGSPAVIFIDEAEALLQSRHSSGIGSSMSMTVVPTFLAEMDGLDDSGAMVLLSTNRPDSLDSAIIRDGRIDKKIHVHRPTQKDTEDIFETYLAKIPTVEGTKTHGEFSEELFHDKYSFYDVTLKDGSVRKFGLKHIVSGAMVSGIVESAISIAMHREIETKKRQEGVCKQDLLDAITKTFNQNKDIRHDEDLKTFTEGFKANVASVQKCVN